MLASPMQRNITGRHQFLENNKEELSPEPQGSACVAWRPDEHPSRRDLSVV